jgi:hypothetical protein
VTSVTGDLAGASDNRTATIATSLQELADTGSDGTGNAVVTAGIVVVEFGSTRADVSR